MKEPKVLRHWIEAYDTKVVVYDQQFNYDFDSYYVMEPKETKSGAWEVWYAEWSGEEMDQADLKHKLIEISGTKITKLDDLHNLLCGLILGFEDGYSEGKRTVQRAAKFALEALTGERDIDPLIESSEEA